MARKRYNKKRRYRRPVGNSLSNVASLASTAFNIAKGVASMLNTEFKYNDIAYVANPLQAAPFLNVVNGINQGQDNFERIGRSIKGTYMFYKVKATWNAAATTNIFRIFTIVDKKADGLVPPITDILTQPTENGFRNLDQGERFEVLEQSCHTLNQHNPIICFEKYISLKDKEWNHTEYKGVTSAIADISSYPIYIIIVSSDNVNPCTMDVSCRYRFVDN